MHDFACRDWFRKLKAGLPPLPDDLPIDREEARLAVQAFDMLRLPDVPGRPRFGDVGAEWSRAFVSAIFGLVKMNEDRTVVVDRLARKFFQLVPKKNSKTTNGAAIMMTAMIRNRRPSAEFLLVGPTQATAERAYEQAAGMVEADPWLKKRFHLRDHIKAIEDRANGAKLRIRSFDTKVMTGAKPVGVLIDELHELGKIASARRVMAQIEGGIIANAEGFVVIITTQSDEPPVGVFKDELKLARDVRDGVFPGGELLPMLYEFPREMQLDPAKPWADPENWPIVLPNAGRSITVDRLLPKFREAESAGREALSIWASQHLNIEIGLALRDDAWAGATYWEAAGDPTLTFEALLERCDVAVVGCDGGGLDDLFGLAVIGRDRETRHWLGWHHAWAHPDVFERRKDITEHLLDFQAAGDLTVCEDPTQDVREVADRIEAIRDAGLLPSRFGIGLDPAGITALIEELAERGIDVDANGGPVVGVAQGYRLNGAVLGLERKLSDGTFRHGASGLMTWCVGNAKAEMRGNAVLITKQISGKAKIDPLVATFNAAVLMARNPTAGMQPVSDDVLFACMG